MKGSRTAAPTLIPILASLVTTFTFLPRAFADVNMMEASFQATFIDLEIGGVKISRTYNSRSNFSGVFGFGWCSTVDAHLEFSTTPEGQALAGVSECGTVGNIGEGQVKFSIEGYTQTLKNGLTRTFSAETGELISLRSRGQPKSVYIDRLKRPGSRTRLSRDAALEEGLKMRLEFDALNENVTALESSSGKRLEFTYSPARDLLSARNAWSNTYRFEYDSLHNLTRIDYPDRTNEKMTYEADQDRLLSFEARPGGCKETYQHKYESAPARLTQSSTSKLICAGRLKRAARFDFIYAKRRHQWSLESLSITRDGGGSKQTTTLIQNKKRGQQ